MNKTNFATNEITSMLDLFKVVPAMPAGAYVHTPVDCAKRGFIVVRTDGALMERVPHDLFQMIDSRYGMDVWHANQTLHKSFGAVAEMSDEDYYTQQLLHYFSTYGLEAFGLKAHPYVPVEKLELPEGLISAERMTLIRICAREEAQTLIDNFAKNTRSPSQRMVEQFKVLLPRVTIPTDQIKSFELQVIKHDLDGTVPSKPESVLRYLVYKTTGQTLIIKNRVMRLMIQSARDRGTTARDILLRADPIGMASIFLRYKPIFLAYKSHEGCAPIINRFRRLADMYHKPLAGHGVKDVIPLAAQGRMNLVQEIILSISDNRDLIKLGNALGLRLSAIGGVNSVYAIRNGRTFVKEGGIQPANEELRARYIQTLGLIQAMLRANLRNELQDRFVVIPDYIEYAVPTTEKQFTGNIPWGTRVTAVPNGKFTVGVMWFDQRGQRVDIDLHLNSATEHIGWNAGRRSGDEIIYTGDQTAAPLPNGAAEAYWFDPAAGDFILSANRFSGPARVDYKMYMTEVKPDQAGRRWNSKYTFNPADAIFEPIPLFFDNENDMTLGLFHDNSFFFYGGSVGRGIVPTANYEQFLSGLTAQLDCKWTMRELLNSCGAIIITPDELDALTDEEKERAIDLTPAALTSTTLLEIVDGVYEG